MRKINLQLNNTKIPILVGSNILKTINPENYVKKNDVVIITNSTIAKLYLKQTKRMFKDYNVDSLILRDGEKYKNIKTLQQIHDYLIKNKYDRSLTIVALGGGVIGDMVAFAADTFMRGVQLFIFQLLYLLKLTRLLGVSVA